MRYLDSLGATNSLKSRKRSGKTVNILLRLIRKEYFILIGLWRVYPSLFKNTFYDIRLSLVLYLLKF